MTNWSSRCPTAGVAEAEERIKSGMEGVYALRVPLIVDISHGRSWAEAH